MTPQLEGTDEADNGDRVYKWNDGAEYPSVTTVLKADPEKKRAIKSWRESHPNPDHYRDRQGQLGRLVHRRVLNQYAIRDLPPEPVDFKLVDDDFKADVETAVSMWDNCSIDVGDDPHVEVAVRNDEHEYAGRFDLLTEGNTLCDLKISAAVRDSYRCQIAAYWRALETMDDYPDPESAAIIRLHPDTGRNPELTPSVERITAEQVDYWFDEFRRIQQIYRGEH
jgi:hypothetical protein